MLGGGLGRGGGGGGGPHFPFYPRDQGRGGGRGRGRRRPPPKEGALVVLLQLDDTLRGIVIGRQGATIKETQRVSGAMLTLPKRGESGPVRQRADGADSDARRAARCEADSGATSRNCVHLFCRRERHRSDAARLAHPLRRHGLRRVWPAEVGLPAGRRSRRHARRYRVRARRGRRPCVGGVGRRRHLRVRPRCRRAGRESRAREARERDGGGG